MKVNKKCVRHMCNMLVICLFIFTACSPDPDTDLLVSEYPALYEAIFARNDSAIIGFTSHDMRPV